jgi:hypothetical protein
MPYEETDGNGRKNLEETYLGGAEIRPAGDTEFHKLDVTERGFTGGPTAGTLHGIPYVKDSYGNWVRAD